MRREFVRAGQVFAVLRIQCVGARADEVLFANDFDGWPDEVELPPGQWFEANEAVGVENGRLSLAMDGTTYRASAHQGTSTRRP